MKWFNEIFQACLLIQHSNEHAPTRINCSNVFSKSQSQVNSPKAATIQSIYLTDLNH